MITEVFDIIIKFLVATVIVKWLTYCSHCSVPMFIRSVVRRSVIRSVYRYTNTQYDFYLVNVIFIVNVHFIHSYFMFVTIIFFQ